MRSRAAQWGSLLVLSLRTAHPHLCLALVIAGWNKWAQAPRPALDFPTELSEQNRTLAWSPPLTVLGLCRDELGRTPSPPLEGRRRSREALCKPGTGS